MKNLFIAVLIAICITGMFGQISDSGLEFDLQVDELHLTGLVGFMSAALVIFVLILVGVVLAVSLFGALVLAIGIVLVVSLIAGLSAFWPFILLLVVITLIAKQRKSEPQY